ncbi:hypothetical protein ACFP1I_16000 [Dyadobacter subterraneus]|uniref:Glycine zipper family protein n=1 Tax=Dyadobacter subterraneus TaxID=2773304 RepID=A0ABR9WL98_9BACT|nr:hypothetical protein [Dyadobacter subterraneus]MBE9465141.1 hypothetical protein [Dyadobacter subterraneus]
MKSQFVKTCAWSMLFFITAIQSVFGQTRKNDQIIKKDSSRIESKILIVEDQIIQYKKVSDPDGPVFHLLKSDIAKIIFGNGEILTFSNQINSPSANKQGSVILYPVRPWVQKEFINDLSIWRTTDLRNAYKYYNDRSKTGKIAAIILGSAGGAAAIAGIIWATNRNKHDPYGYYSSTDDGPTVLIVAGLSTGLLGGLIGGIKSKKDHSNAILVGEELKKRNESLTSFGIRPTLNPLTKSGSLSLILKF